MKGLARIDLLPLEILPLQLGLVIDAPRHVYGTYYFLSIFERKSRRAATTPSELVSLHPPLPAPFFLSLSPEFS